MSALVIVLIVLAAIIVLLFVGGLAAARRREREQAPFLDEHIAEADRALEAARASDRGWDRELMEQAARDALAQAHPGKSFERLELVLVDDKPGVEEDRAQFEGVSGDTRVRVELTRGGDGWSGQATA